MSEKPVILGLTEHIIVHDHDAQEEVLARIDTGAETSSMDASLAAELSLGPIERVMTVKSANGKKVRPVVRCTIELGGKRVEGLFSLADRSHMTYRMLIGQDVLKQGFLINPNKGGKR